MAQFRSERGFALPTTVFLVTILTVMLATALARASSDHEVANSGQFSVNALAVAQSGLQTYLDLVNFDACGGAIRPPNGDSVRINVNGGYSDVVVHVVQRPVDSLGTWMYIVRSTGSVIEPTQGADPQAVRTVAQFAQWQTNQITVLAAYTAANGFPNLGTSTGELKGIDQAPSGCADPSVAALRVPTGEAPGSWTGYVLNGSVPNVLESGTKQEVALATNFAWLAATTGTLVPDYTSIVFRSDYPTILVTGDLNLDIGATNQTGTGLLIVTGDLNVEGTALLQWNGVVLVGKRISFNAADQRFDGIVISGLEGQIGGAGRRGRVQGSYLDIDYDSYEVHTTLRSFAGFVPITNTWIDNWATY